MSIRRGPVPAADHFTIVPNAWARDERLSWAAHGLLAYLLSHREGWVISGVRDLARRSRTGREATDTAVRELVRYGYLTRTRTHGPGGRFSGVDYVLTGDPLPPGVEPADDVVAVVASTPGQAPQQPERPLPGNPDGGAATTAREATAREPDAWLPSHKEDDPEGDHVKKPPQPPASGGSPCTRHPSGPPTGVACRACGTDAKSLARRRQLATSAAASAAAAVRAAARTGLGAQRDPDASTRGAAAVRAARQRAAS